MLHVRRDRGGLANPIVSIVIFHMKRNDPPLNYKWRKTVISMQEDPHWYAGRQLLVCRKTLISMQEDSY